MFVSLTILWLFLHFYSIIPSVILFLSGFLHRYYPILYHHINWFDFRRRKNFLKTRSRCIQTSPHGHLDQKVRVYFNSATSTIMTINLFLGCTSLHFYSFHFCCYKISLTYLHCNVINANVPLCWTGSTYLGKRGREGGSEHSRGGKGGPRRGIIRKIMVK